MLINFRTRWTPFTTPELQRSYILTNSWELDEFGDISEYFSSLGINYIMSESKCTYDPLYDLRRKTRDMLTDFTYDLME